MPPTALINSLEAIRRKVKLLSVTFGLGILLATIVGLALAVIGLDYLLNLPAVPRLALLAIVLFGIGYVLWHWVIRPWAVKISLSDVAGRLEHAFPQFDDRLRSTVDFLREDIPGSDMMKQRVIGEATSLAATLHLDRAIVMRPVWYSLGSGFAAIVLAMLLGLLVSSSTVRIAISRLVNPFTDMRWPRRVQIDLVGSVPTRVPVGQRVEVKMRLARGDKPSMQAIVFYQYGDGPVQRELMQRAADGTYAASLDAKLDGASAGLMKIWMKSGDDEMVLNDISVVPRLAIKSIEAAITPPSYVTGAQPVTVNLSAAPALAAVGSKVDLRVAFNKPLGEKDVVIEPVEKDAKAPDVKWTRDGEMAAIGTWLATDSLRFHVRGTDKDNFTNTAFQEFELIVRPDQNPVVQIESPRRNEERTPQSVVPLQGMAEDDYGIKSLKLVIDRLGDKKHWEMPLVEESTAKPQAAWNRIDSLGERLRFRVGYQWDFASLKDANLKPGDVIEYFLLAQDNYEFNGKFHDAVPSGKLRINIISQEDLTNRVVDELRTAKNQISEVSNTQTRTKQETQSLAQDTKDKQQFDQADRATAERLGTQQSTAASQAKQIAGKLEALEQRLEENKSQANDLKQIARDVKNDLNNAAENSMKNAAAKLAEAQQNQQKDARNDDLKQAHENQQRANDQLNQAMDRMANIGSLQQTIDRINQILNEQQEISKQTQEIGRENIGKKPEDMKPEDRQKLDKNAQEQAKLAERTNKAIDEMKKQSEQMQKSDPSSAEAMKKAADTAQQQQVSQNQQKASQQAKQNQQQGAQSAQKQAELGLQMVLNDLREAEQRKLAEIQRQLAELQKQVELLIKRQAGHNIDNLLIQGPGRIAKLDAKVMPDLFAKATRDPKAAPAPVEVPTLTNGQEQTERNTRDIGKTAEAMPNGAEPAANLTRAAGKMERAIVSLRDQKLPDAYDPSQLEALSALEDAKKRIDEMKEKVDQKIDENQKEGIRQQFVKIRQEQEAINGTTIQIDKAPKLADGTLKREDAVRLGQLPGQQGKLADTTNKLNEVLSGAGGIVYVWANKDIVKTMNDVKASLGKPNTGASTQIEQKRIVAQLDAMIRNLAIKPVQSKFAQDAANQGGGGQQGGQQKKKPTLPTEAELRLMKDFQLAVNDATKAMAQAKEKDKEALVATGIRQGEMRNLLDQIVKKSSGGELSLGPEPDPKTQLPEEANEEQVENQELDEQLLNGKAEDAGKETDQQANLIGTRMARSKQRLAQNLDPGKTTQIIQQRIVIDLDLLIDQARQQQAQARNAPQNQQGQQQNQPKQGENAQAQNQGQQQNQQQKNPAQDSTAGVRRQAAAEDLAKQIQETMQEWGGLTPRQRAAVIDGKNETVIETYRKLVEDYYKSLSTKSSER
ncbi:MAG TPA: DUF4175 family protein [Tepidisphaeraceae bacterium]|nr:DUF4175 family protein [Tepidisphaeraceae bacterium]